VDTVDVRAFDRWSYGSEQDKPTETVNADKLAKVAKIDALAETRGPGEAYADTRQSSESGWEQDRRFDAPRSELAQFRTECAGLPEIGPEAAARYLDQHRAARPWLDVAARASPDSRRILAAIDQGTGHGHIRHEGWVTEEANMRRVAYLEDPAQLDKGKRLGGIDGLKPNDNRHRCADLATRITDPGAFATAFARGAEHSEIRAALRTPYDRFMRPDPVRVPIADLLGKDGHKYCTGWQLEPVAGSMDAAIKNRRAWRTALEEGRQPDVPKSVARPVPTFEGGTIIFFIGPNRAQDGYEIVNMCPEPRDDDFLAS
jgi:hypothetical protein